MHKSGVAAVKTFKFIEKGAYHGANFAARLYGHGRESVIMRKLHIYNKQSEYSPLDFLQPWLYGWIAWQTLTHKVIYSFTNLLKNHFYWGTWRKLAILKWEGQKTQWCNLSLKREFLRTLPYTVFKNCEISRQGMSIALLKNTANDCYWNTVITKKITRVIFRTTLKKIHMSDIF